MTSISIASLAMSGAAPARRLPPELLDGITDAVLSTDPAARADVICLLVREIYDSVAWLDADLVDGELVSLRRIVDDANTHQAWLAAHADAPGSPSSTDQPS